MHVIKNPSEPEKQCSRCQRIIILFEEHVLLKREMLDGSLASLRFCNDCCHEPRNFISMADVMDKPVKRIWIRKVWA